MPKQKTHRGAAKRLSITKTGKVKRAQAYKSHILTKKTTKAKRQLRGTTNICASDVASVIRMMPSA